jgi:hypothetical protein
MSTASDSPGAGQISTAIAFRRSTRIVDPCRPRFLDGGIASTTRFLLVMISIVMTRGRSLAQSSTQAQTPAPSSIAAHEVPGDNPRASVPHGWLERDPTTPCSIRVPDAIAQPAENDKETTTTTESAAYTPLSVRCKFNLFRMSTYSPYTFLSAGFQATWAQAMGQWPHYGGGMQGWGKRLGATLADTESRRFIQGFALSTILHQDPRYFPSHKRSLISRAWYATTRVMVTRSDRGDSTFNSSEFLGALFTSSLQNAYYPRHDRNVGETMNRCGGALSSDAIGDLLREFTPDIKRLFRKHAPKKIREIEDKLPIPPDDKP